MNHGDIKDSNRFIITINSLLVNRFKKRVYVLLKAVTSVFSVNNRGRQRYVDAGEPHLN